MRVLPLLTLVGAGTASTCLDLAETFQVSCCDGDPSTQINPFTASACADACAAGGNCGAEYFPSTGCVLDAACWDVDAFDKRCEPAWLSSTKEHYVVNVPSGTLTPAGVVSKTCNSSAADTSVMIVVDTLTADITYFGCRSVDITANTIDAVQFFTSALNLKVTTFVAIGELGISPLGVPGSRVNIDVSGAAYTVSGDEWYPKSCLEVNLDFNATTGILPIVIIEMPAACTETGFNATVIDSPGVLHTLVLVPGRKYSCPTPATCTCTFGC